MIGKPGDYAPGSLESRAAARALLERLQTEREENVILVRIEHIGDEGANRTLKVYLPNGQAVR